MDMYDYYGYGYNPYGFMDGFGVVAIISLLLAVIAAIALVMYYTSTDYGKKMQGSGRTLYRLVNFDIYLMPFIVRFLYLFFTIFSLIMGVYMMFQDIDKAFLMGLLTMVGGVILVRLIFEAIYLIFSFRELLYKISKNTADSAVAAAPEAHERPVITECPDCGTSVKPGQAFCVNCGKKLN
jgi:hypothetical protein